MPRRGSSRGSAVARLKPIVLVNKIDRPMPEPMRVHDEVLELLMTWRRLRAVQLSFFIRRVAWHGDAGARTSRERR